MTTSTKPVLSASTSVTEALRDFASYDKGILLDWVQKVLTCPISEALPLLSAIGAEGYAAIPLLEARVKAQILASAPKGKTAPITVKTSRKGAVSVYGLSAKWPVTLYAQQWERFAGEVLPKILAHINQDPPTDHKADKQGNPAVKGVRISRK